MPNVKTNSKVPIIILFILLIAVVFVVIRSEQAERASVTSTVVDGKTVEVKDELQTSITTTNFSTNESVFGANMQLKYPVNAVVNESPGLLEISYTGVNNTLEDTVTDGYRLSITTHKDTDLTNFLQSQLSASAVQPVQVGGKDGYTYVSILTSGEQPEEHVIFSPDENLVVDVSYIAAGTTKASYRELVWNIINSIEIL